MSKDVAYSAMTSTRSKSDLQNEVKRDPQEKDIAIVRKEPEAEAKLLLAFLLIVVAESKA
jgi:hypothetical protein